MLCILYVTAVGLLLGMMGVLVERLMPPTMARRWIWSSLLPVSIVLPGYYRMHHSFAVGEAPDAAAFLGIDAGIWRQIGSVDLPIGRAWLIASGLLVLCALLNAGWVSHSLRLSRAAPSAAPITLIDGIPVVVTNSLGPATVGVWRSRVVLPRWVLALPSAQRQYVTRHEEEHRRAHDCALLCLASLSVIVMPWNVALWWQLRRLKLAVELDCDNRVIKALGNPQAYGTLLLAIAQASQRTPRLQPAFLGGAGMLERRLTMLLAPAPLRFAQRVLLPVLAAALLIVVLRTPHPLMEHHGHAHVATASAPGARS